MELTTGLGAVAVIVNRFGELLARKQAQEQRRVSLSEVAADTGISWKTLQAWQLNTVQRFDAPVLDALCAYFAVQPGELIVYLSRDAEDLESSHLPSKSD